MATHPPVYSHGEYGPVYAQGNAHLILGNVYQHPVADDDRQQKSQRERQRCHQIFKTSHYEKYKDRNPSPVAGTCRWVLENPHFLEWRSSQQNALLWISADPGCGKSVLSRALVDNGLCGDSSSTVCYFFFKDNNEQDNLATALCAVLHQLFKRQPYLTDHAMEPWEINGEKLREETQEMWRILRASAADKKADPIICVFDALDECNDCDREMLISLLCEIQDGRLNGQSFGSLKVIVTSRPYDNVQRWFEQTTRKWPRIRLRGEDKNDTINEEINLVIDQRVENLMHEFSLTTNVQKRIQEQLKAMQHRTYLWLQLAMEEVREICRDSIHTDEIQVLSLPVSVEDAYERILSKIKRRQQTLARQVLLIIVGARRPLSITEMAEALSAGRASQHDHSYSTSIDPQRLEQQIREQCGLFVFVNHTQLFLIHQTAKEFLVAQGSALAQNPLGWKSCLDPSQIEREMSVICVTYLYNHMSSDHRHQHSPWMTGPTINPDLVQLHGEPNIKSFWHYCAAYWTSHLHDDFIRHDEDLLAKVLSLFQMSGDRLPDWLSVMWKAVFWDRQLPALRAQHVIAITGHAFALEKMLEIHNNVDLDAKDSTNRTALQRAAEGGHLEIVRLLLERGSNVNAKGGTQGNALYTAMGRGDEQLVQLLLDKGADIYAEGEKYSSALQAASAGGYSRVVQLLLKHNVAASVQGGELSSALYIAVWHGHQDIVRLLLDQGANINANGGFYGSALQAASWHGHHRIVQLLLERGANIHATGHYGNALQMACWRAYDFEPKYVRLVQLLLKHGADVNAVGGDYGSALYAASYGGSKSLVRLLLDSGADENIDAEAGYYGSALQAASWRGCHQITQLLLEAGANINTTGECGSALYAASRRGHDSLVKLFLENGADVTVEGAELGNPLQAAAEGGHEKIVRMLLDRGVDVNMAGGRYGNALQAASWQGNDVIVQLLLDHGANSSATGGRYGSALQAALRRDHNRIARLLRKRGAHVGVEDELYSYAHSAAFADSDEQVLRLLEQGNGSSERSEVYGHALCTASAKGHERIVRLLLDQGVNVNTISEKNGSALQTASAEGHEQIVKLLLDRGADISQTGGLYGSALQAASWRGHKQIERLLLDHGTKTIGIGGGYSCALHPISFPGCEEAIQFLLEERTDIEDQQEPYSQILEAASQGDREQVAQLVQQHRTSLSQQVESSPSKEEDLRPQEDETSPTTSIRAHREPDQRELDQIREAPQAEQDQSSNLGNV